MLFAILLSRKGRNWNSFRSPFTNPNSTSAGAGFMYAGDRWTVRYALTGTGGTRPWVHTLLLATSPR